MEGAGVPPLHNARGLPAVAGWALAGGLAFPALGLAGAPIHASAFQAIAATVVAVVVAAAAWWAAAGSRLVALAGLVAVAAASALMPWASYPGSGFVVAALTGAGVGALLPRARQGVALGVPAIAVAGILTLARVTAGIEVAAVLFFAAALVASAAALWLRRGSQGVRRTRGLAAAGAPLALAASSVFWVSSTSPRVEWFGSLTSHGPRGVPEVAITFDDGPNGADTLAIAAILESHGARGTFFQVGKAVAREPNVTRTLVERGHVVGNHSQNHGAFSYLDPRYPELARAQETIFSGAGVCPGLFRPPHGTHTPFMSRAVGNRDMRLVTWDVSAKDWVESDSDALARHILERVRPGSIILLHDGLDGRAGADRSVVVRALPAILDGLERKGLRPVTLDRLLGVAAYVPGCEK